MLAVVTEVDTAVPRAFVQVTCVATRLPISAGDSTYVDEAAPVIGEHP
jgi:hypothetical protein